MSITSSRKLARATRKAPIRIALYNELLGAAESQAAASFRIAAGSLGIVTKECASASEIEEFEPTFVLCFSQRESKTTVYPTYGMAHSPRCYLQQSNVIHTIRSWDGYTSTSALVANHVDNIRHQSHAKLSPAFYYNTCHRTSWPPSKISESSRLVYFSTNWDGRDRSLIPAIQTRGWFDLYGPRCAWPDPPPCYRGEIPFDGASVLQVYASAGIGLSLFSPEFVQDDTVSNRIFEITASGALAICGDMPFIRRHFKDSVLYVDQSVDAKNLVRQIEEHFRWAISHPAESAEKIREASHIFAGRLSMEALIPNICDLHIRSQAQLKDRAARVSNLKYHVAVIVRTGSRPVSYLERALRSLAHQSHRPLTVILTEHSADPAREPVVERWEREIGTIHRLQVSAGLRSTSLWTALRDIRARGIPWFAVLDDDDELLPEHFTDLFTLVDRRSALVAYTGYIREESDGKRVLVPPRLQANVWSSDHTHITGALAINGFLAATCLLDERDLEDPLLGTAEDTCLHLTLLTKTAPVLSQRCTALVHSDAPSRADRTSAGRGADMARLRLRFFGAQILPPALDLYPAIDVQSLASIDPPAAPPHRFVAALVDRMAATEREFGMAAAASEFGGIMLRALWRRLLRRQRSRVSASREP